MTTSAPATPQSLDERPYLRLIDALISFRNEKDEIIGVKFAAPPDRTRYGNLYANAPNARCLDSIKQKLLQGDYVQAERIYREILRVFTESQDWVDKADPRWSDAVLLEVVLKREWSREPDLPAIPQVEKNVDQILAKPPTEDQIIRLRFVDQLIKYGTKKGPNIGSHFRWLPLLSNPEVHCLPRNVSSLEIIRSNIRKGIDSDDIAIYAALKRVFRGAAESAVRGSNRHQMAVQMECALVSLWSANPKLPTLLQPAIQDILPATAVREQTPSYQPANSSQLPYVTIPNHGGLDHRGPAQAAATAHQSEAQIFEILDIPTQILSQLARASTLAAFNTWTSSYPRYGKILQTIKAGGLPPKPAANIDISHTGLPVLLNLQMDGLESGLICNPRSNGFQDYDREAYCTSRVNSLLQSGRAPPPDFTTHVRQLAVYIAERQDEQISIEVRSARDMAYVALSTATKDLNLTMDASYNPSPALKRLYLQQAHMFYCYFFEQALLLLKSRHSGVISLVHQAQASAAAALVALHVAALQIVLVYTRGDDLQLTSAVETGITPANLMHGVTNVSKIPSEPQLPSVLPGEDSSYACVAVSDENSRVASQILLDSHQWNRLRPIYRNFLLAFSRAAYKRNPYDPVLKTVLLRISTFYPDDPDLLLLMSSVFLIHREPIVTLFLAKNLLDHQLTNNGRTAEALNNMAAAYSALGRPDLAQDCIARTENQPDRCWSAIRMNLHLRRRTSSQSTSESRVLAGLQACETAERNVFAEDGSSPSNGFSLDELYEVQRLRLLRARLLLQHKEPHEALLIFLAGLQVGLALPNPTSGSAPPDTAQPTCRHLFEALYLHICYRRVLQQGAQAGDHVNNFRNGIKKGTGGQYDPQDILQFPMPFLGMYPDLLAALPLPPMEGIVPPVLLTPQSVSKLAASVFGTASLPYTSLPAALSDTISDIMRRVADNKICALTNLLVFGICRIMEVYGTQTTPEDEASYLSKALFANTGFRFCAGTKLMLYYLSYSLKPSAEAIVNMCIIFASLQGTTLSKVQTNNGSVTMKPIDFAVFWSKYGVEKKLLKEDDPAVLEISKIWKGERAVNTVAQ